MTKRLAIIPARCGSKRIPEKNIRDFCGMPMIGHVLKTACASHLFNTIHVSTESCKVAKVAGMFGYAPEFLRPIELADDFTPLMPVLKFVVNEFLKADRLFDEIWLLMPCSPLLDIEDLLCGAHSFVDCGSSSPLIAVTAYSSPVERSYYLDDQNNLTPVSPLQFATRSQDLRMRYHDAGSFYIYNSESIMNSAGAGDNRSFRGLVLPKYRAVDIDDEEDWKLAEMIFRGRSSRA